MQLIRYLIMVISIADRLSVQCALDVMRVGYVCVGCSLSIPQKAHSIVTIVIISIISKFEYEIKT